MKTRDGNGGAAYVTPYKPALSGNAPVVHCRSYEGNAETEISMVIKRDYYLA